MGGTERGGGGTERGGGWGGDKDQSCKMSLFSVLALSRARRRYRKSSQGIIRSYDSSAGEELSVAFCGCESARWSALYCFGRLRIKYHDAQRWKKEIPFIGVTTSCRT